MRQLLYTLLLLSAAQLAWAQGGVQVQFGKNRVQHHQDFDEWSQYESDNFITYWYGESRNIGQATVMIAEKEFGEVQDLLEHRINQKIQIIVYTDLTDLKQSNIGSDEVFSNTAGQTKIVENKVFVYFNGDHESLRRQIREGIAEVYLDDMLFGSNLQEIVQNAVAMNLPEWFKRGLVGYAGEGWSPELDNQLRDAMLSKDFENFEMLAEENPKLAGHSLWYFIGENFGPTTVSNLLYLTRINRSVESGFLYVLGSPYEIITNSWTMYFRNRYMIEDGQRGAPTGKDLELKNKRKLPVSQLKLSPDGTKAVYSTNEIGRFRVFLQDVRTGEREVIFKEGFRNAFQATDYTYPLLAWSPNNAEVMIAYEHRDIIHLLTYDINTHKTETQVMAPDYQRLHSIDYVNPFTLTMSATVKGASDVFLYFTKTRQSERITNDFYDDLDAAYAVIGGKKGILFASNRSDSMLQTLRLDSILPLGNFDIFFYDLDTRDKELIQVTRTFYANERSPIALDSTRFAYLSDRSGLFNREVGYFENYIHHYEKLVRLKDGSEYIFHIDSVMTGIDTTQIDSVSIHPAYKKRAITSPQSNYRRSIIEQTASTRSGNMAEMLYHDGQFKVFVLPVTINETSAILNTAYRQESMLNLKQQMPKEEPVPIPDTRIQEQSPTPPMPAEELPVEKQDTGKIDIDNYSFQSEFDDEDEPPTMIKRENNDRPAETPQQPSPITRIEDQPQPSARKTPAGALQTLTAPGVYRFRPGKIIPYRTQFRTNFVTTQLDNSLLFEGMESFTSNPGNFGYPPPGILLKANFKDLFEDYEFEGGVRVPTTFNGTEYFLTFNNKKKRLDKRFSVYRRNLRYAEESNSFVPMRREVNTLLGQFGVRYPLDIFRSLRATATIRRDRVIQLATERVALEEPTIREQRASIRAEYVFDNTLDVATNIKNGTRYKFYAEAVKRFNVDVSTGAKLELNDGFMTVLGFDARHYQRLDKHSILAVRLAGATSFGSEKMLYYLGGVDNWLFPSFNNDIPTPEGGNFAYQLPASSLRGFRFNIRNGNSYALLNSELRVPVFKYFSRRIRSAFFRNFQVVGFFDMGTAWQGLNPFSNDNPLNTSYYPSGVTNPPVEVKVNYFRDPIVIGYGLGVRTILFGYFLRLDYAWGIETRQVQDPRLFISMGFDF